MKQNWMKGISLLLILTMMFSLLIGCSDTPADETDGSTSGKTTTTTDGETDTSSTDASGESTDPSASGSTTSGNNKTTNNPGGTTKAPTTTTTTKSNQKSNYYQISTGKFYQNMTFAYKATGTSYNVGNAVSYLDLGEMQLEEYPIDGVYDNAFNIIKVGDTYKMWWCRACPFDTIWYAESKDLKNWYNAQEIIDLNGYTSTNLKSMLSWPSVLYVDGKYHMFFEGPAKLGETTEYSNNIFYASSKDGIKWTFYPNNKDPKPVIVNPVVKEGVYGVGQPKAFYKDGYFYVVYTDASAGGGDIRVARSKGNGYSFEGTVSTHTKLLSGVAGAAVRYNSVTKKYYMVFTASETKNGVYNDNIYMMETTDLYNWPYKTRAQAISKAYCLSKSNDVCKKSNVDFVTDSNGIVTSENMNFVYMNGDMPSATEDHRNTHTTWDGHIAVVAVGSKYNKGFTLPNGKAANATNLEWYADKVATWTRPSLSVSKGTPAIDGTMDAVYGKGGTALVESVTWSYEDCDYTDTTGKVNFSWDENALYVYAQISDKTGPYTNAKIEKPGNLWRNDGITVFVDVPDTMTGTNNKETLTPLSFMCMIDAAGTCTIKDSSETVVTNEFSGIQTKTKKVSGGYVIEAKLPWHSMVKSMVKSGKTIGVDVQINDNFGDAETDRQAQVYWSDYTGDAFLYLDHYGQLKLN